MTVFLRYRFFAMLLLFLYVFSIIPSWTWHNHAPDQMAERGYVKYFTGKSHLYETATSVKPFCKVCNDDHHVSYIRADVPSALIPAIVYLSSQTVLLTDPVCSNYASVHPNKGPPFC